ncbi:MAG: ATP-dependent helicase [Acholeplasmatales bacterium]
MLNEKQTKAAYANERFIFLLAGAGSGKTRVLIERVKYLINKGINPEKILLITFTRKATLELTERLPKGNVNPLITTFHGFCYKMLSPLMELNLVKEEYLISEGFTKDEIRNIDIEKRNNINSKLIKRYHQLLKKKNLIDFVDLEIILLKKLKNKQFKKYLSSKYPYILIDEFQDTSKYQFLLLQRLLNEESHFFAVGDPDQSIYGFRGANRRVIKSYIKYFNAKTYILDTNYRSKENIVKLSNKLISHNKDRFDKRLESFSKEKGEITIKYFKNKENKNEFIIKELRRLLNEGVKYDEIAILYRNHYVANELKEALYNTYIMDVNLLTIHQAKGLEFKAVFIIGLNEGILPMEEIEEERRLLYVAITRAKDYLYLLVNREYKVSRFIVECFL